MVTDDDPRLGTQFEPGPSGNSVCLICRCLVRSGRADLKVHLGWHDSMSKR